MKAFVARGFGGPEVMGLAALPDPEPGTGEVVVEIRATGVNPLDWMMRNGYFGPGSVPRFPRALGADFAGTVRAVGKGVTGLAPGTAVYGDASPLSGEQGTHAERVAVPASRVHPMPRGLTFEQAAALPTAALTVLDACWRIGSVLGKRVLVVGATSGVGHFAVQIAGTRGARVTAVCGQAHFGRMRSLGASEVIDEDGDELATSSKRYDVLIDGQGGVDVAAASRVLVRRGTFVTTMPLRSSWPRTLLRRLLGGPRLIVAVPRGRAEDYEVLARLVAAGRVRPVLSDVYPLERAGEAFAAQESGRVLGKVVIRVGEGRAPAGPPGPGPH